MNVSKVILAFLNLGRHTDIFVSFCAIKNHVCTFQSDIQQEELNSFDSSVSENPQRKTRPIHKTSSADAAMMAAEDLPVFSLQAKPKRSL